MKDLWFHIVGEIFWQLDRTRADEVLAVIAVVAVAAHLLSGISFHTLFLLLCAAQLMFQWFDVRKAVQGWKYLTRGDK